MVGESEEKVPSWITQPTERVVYLELDKVVAYDDGSQAAAWTKKSWAAFP